MERRGGDLEAEADDHHGEREEGHAWRRTAAKAGGDRGDAGGTGGAECERNAVEEERGGKRAEQEVLDGGLGGRDLGLAEAGHDVSGDGRDLEADEDHQELDRTGHQHHADGAEEDQRVVLAGVAGFAFKVFERAEQRGDDDCGDKQVEENAEGVDLNAPAECGEDAEAKLVPTDEACGDRARDGQPTQRLAAAGGFEHRLNEHDEHAGAGENVLREERNDLSGESHQRAPPGVV